MKTLISGKFSVLWVLILLLGTSPVFAQSDYQTVRNYQTEYNNILNAIKDLQSSSEAEALQERIQSFERQFQDHSTLINRFIHPEQFNAQVSNLRDLTSATRNHLARSEQQSSEIDGLNSQISDLNQQIRYASEQSDSLRNTLEELTRRNNANVATIRNLRSQLNERDEFILGLVDSLYVAYDRLDLDSLPASERREFTLSADRDNVLGHINSVVENNISFIETHSQLSSADYLKMRASFARFNSSWEKLGTKLANIYEPSERRSDKITEINAGMERWNSRIDEAMWRSLNSSFNARNIELDSFSSASSFYQALNRYLDNAIARAAEQGGSEEELARYEQFSNIWNNDVKAEWQEFMTESRILTYENFAAIDRKLSQWNVESQPVSSSWLIVAGVLGLVIVILIIMLVSRSKSAEPKKA